MPFKVENIVRKREIACYKQFLLALQYFLELYIFSVSQNVALYGNGLRSNGNRRNLWLPALLLFQKCFQNAQSLKVVIIMIILDSTARKTTELTM